jgi:hypothetical protein
MGQMALNQRGPFSGLKDGGPPIGIGSPNPYLQLLMRPVHALKVTLCPYRRDRAANTAMQPD